MAKENASFSLEEPYQEMLKFIAGEERRSQTEQIRIWIDQWAVQHGVKPLKPVAEKNGND